METCQIHQTKIDQSSKLVPIAPIHDAGDEHRIDGTSFSDWSMVHHSDRRREHNTLCHRMSACCWAVMPSSEAPNPEVVWSVLYSKTIKRS
jgi:hypothetical protein